MEQDGRHRVVVVGGGFGGLAVTRRLKRAPVSVTLIDRRNHHLFQPLLYQVATGALSPANIASPLRGILASQKNCSIFLDEVRAIDLVQRVVHASDDRIPYDTLVVAAGASHSYFGHDDWKETAPGLKTIEDATEIRSRIFAAFEAAEREDNPARRRAMLNFVVVGGGPTGVELAGALAEIAHYTLRREFRVINPSDARIVLVEAGDHVLGVYPSDLSEKARSYLRKLGVEVRCRSLVTDVRPDSVIIKSDTGMEVLGTSTVLWAAGVQASPLGRMLADAAKITVDRAGRIPVLPDLTIEGHPEVFVIGDMASVAGVDGKPLPGLAPVAIQQGKYVARTIGDRLKRLEVKPFHYRDWGSMATIGRAAAVGQIKGWKFSGAIAWLMWLFIHLMYIVEFENRMLVLAQWTWSYLTFDRSARLITGEIPPVLVPRVDESNEGFRLPDST